MKYIILLIQKIFYKFKSPTKNLDNTHGLDDDNLPTENVQEKIKSLYDTTMTEQYKSEMSAILKHKPTTEQWEMILTPEINVSVIAGAGAGKSTTLALRVVFLVKYLHIDINEVKIISFTNKSCDEMRDKLIDLFKLYSLEEHSSEVIKSIVQTFHSLAFSQYSKLSIYTKGFFEQLPVNKTSDLNVQLSKKNYACFKNIFGELYSYNDEFKNAIDKLRTVSKLEHNENENIETKHVISKLQAHTISEIIKLQETYINLSHNVKISVHGKLPDPDGRFLVITDGRNKDYWKLVSLMDDPIYVIEDINADLDTLEHDLKYSQKKYYPFTSLFIKNEIGSQINIIDYVYTEIQYAESLNLSFEDLDTNNLPDSESFENYKIIIMKSVWQKFNDYLKEEGLQTANKIFSQLTKWINDDKISSNDLSNINHLMIDEFQDISPQLVAWITACRKKIELNQNKTSFMCVGDDWQSIYGWRGSNPIFITHFGDYFGDSKVINMNNNFRSTQNIIDSAELLMDQVKNKTVNRNGTASHPEYINKCGSVEIYDFSVMSATEIMNQLIANFGYEKIFLISKITNDIKLFKNALGITKKFSGELTIHKSKGLEQEVVVIIDSPSVPKDNYVRDYLFSLIKLHQNSNNSYKTLKSDEEYRLMYVAITRAKSKCIWFNFLPHKKFPTNKSTIGSPFNYLKNKLK